MSFLTFKEAPEQIEILTDAQGIDNLISYLQQIKEHKDHMQLIVDSSSRTWKVYDGRPARSYNALQLSIRWDDE